MTSNEPPSWAETLSEKLDRLIHLTETQLRVQRVAALGPDRIVTINHRGVDFRIHVPFGEQDYIQRTIVTNRGFYEANLLQRLSDMAIVPAEGVIVDVGANIGNHTVFFGHFLEPRRLYCFEPQQVAFSTLTRNIELNLEHCDVRARQAMLGAETGMGGISRYQNWNQGGAEFEAAEDGRTEMLRLDEAVDPADIPDIALIKIDVERAQTEVLRGATGVLTEARPALWIEIFDEEREETDNLLKEFGYTGERLTASNYLYRAEPS